MKNITIKDVAQLAGVSTATVSRALNRDPSVKAETQQMIEDACTRLGYSSDRAARRLRTGETRVHKVIAAHDVGRAINPLTLEGQIEGGIVMGIGFALTEHYIQEDGKP